MERANIVVRSDPSLACMDESCTVPGQEAAGTASTATTVVQVPNGGRVADVRPGGGVMGDDRATSTPEEEEGEGAATLVITLRVKQRKKPQYETWSAGIGAAAETFKGFVSRDVTFFPVDDECFGSSTLLRFRTQADLRAWNASTERDDWVKSAEKTRLFRVAKINEVDGGGVAVLPRLKPKPAKVLPPPKWKLALVVWLQVWLAVVAATEAGVQAALMEDGWLEYEPALLVTLLVVVSFIVYVSSPLFTMAHIKGYGIAAWLKRSRIKVAVPDPKQGCAFHLRVVFRGLQNIANDGFPFFNPAPPPPPSPELMQRLSRLEGSLEALKRKGYMRRASAVATEPLPELAGVQRMLTDQNDEMVRNLTEAKEGAVPISADSKDPELGTSTTGPISVSIHHRVRWECSEEFAQWQQDIISSMKKYEGFMNARLIADDVLRPDSEFIQTVIFKFDSVETLQVWMLSDDRLRHIRALEPMLASPDEVTATQDRLLPDVFTDVFVPQGNSVGFVPPPKWKVCILTVLSLFLTLWPLSVHLPRHFLRWGLSEKYSTILVQTGITVTINMYFSAPFLTNMFGFWLKMPRPAYVRTTQPWKLIETGFAWKSSITLAFISYFLSCTLAAFYGKYGSENQ